MKASGVISVKIKFVNENSNRVNITRPAWPKSEFAQDLKTMYGDALKLSKEDKESYEEAEKYLKEGTDMKYVLEGNLFDNIRAKRERIAKGSGEKKAEPGDENYPENLEKIAKKAAINEVLVMPKEDESEDDFISRFMSSKQAKIDFPDHKQRLAVAFSQLKRAKKLNEQLYRAEFAVEVDGRKTGVVDAENEDDAITKVIRKFNIDAENIKKLNEDFSLFLSEDINPEEKTILEEFILQEEKKQKSSFLFFLLKFIPERRLNKLILDLYNSASSKLSEPSEKEELKKIFNIEGKNKKEKIALLRNLLSQAPESDLSSAAEKSISMFKSKINDKTPKQISEDALIEEYTPQEKQEQIQSLQRNASTVSSLVGVSPILLMQTPIGQVLGVSLFLIPVVFGIIMSRVVPKLIERIKNK
jgi:hypothetical protein